MPTLTIIGAVPWDPDRADNARRLAEATGAEIVWDSTRRGYETFLDKLRRQGNGPAIHLEDDIDLCPRWRERIEEAIAARPEVVIQFFSIRRSDVGKPSHDRPGSDFLNVQCWYLPGRLAPDLLAFLEVAPYRQDLDLRGRPLPKSPTDLGVRTFLAERGEHYHQHLPSLVQHLPWTSAINPKRPRHRQSLTFGR